MRLINLTPHTIVLQAHDGKQTSIPSSGLARVKAVGGGIYLTTELSGLPVPIHGAPAFGEVEGLPAPEEWAVYIVSGVVASALSGKGRTDVVSPGTGPGDGAIRDEKNQIVAVTRLIQAPQ